MEVYTEVVRDKDKISPKGKFAIFIGVLLNLTSGIQYCWSLLGKQLIADYGWTTLQATRPYSILTLVSSLFSIVSGRWGDKTKHRYPIIFGGIMLGSGLILSSMHSSPILMCVTAGVILGLSSGPISGNVAASSIKWTPPSKKGLVTGIITCGISLSALYMTPLINTLLPYAGLKNTFVYMGVAALIIIPVLAFIHPQPDKTQFEHSDDSANQVEDTSKYKDTVTPNQALKTKELYVSAIIYFCGAMCGQVLASQATIIAGVQAPDWMGASVLVIILALSNACGRLFWSSLGDKIGPFNSSKFMLGIQFVNLLCFNYFRSPVSLTIGCVILGFCFGGVVPMLWGHLTSVYGRKYIGSLQGMVTSVWGISGMIGPMIAAYLMDVTGGYSITYIFLAVLLLIGFIATFVVKDNKMVSAKN